MAHHCALKCAAQLTATVALPAVVTWAEVSRDVVRLTDRGRHVHYPISDQNTWFLFLNTKDPNRNKSKSTKMIGTKYF